MTKTLDEATLDRHERRAAERFVELLESRLGDELVAVWLYGSRARGERPNSESDVDVIVVTRQGYADAKAVYDELWKATEETGAFTFSIQVFDPEWIEGRREIRSFYIQEVDRDKIVLYGEP